MHYREIREALTSSEADFGDYGTSSHSVVDAEVTSDLPKRRFNTTNFAICLAGLAGTAICAGAAYLANNPEAVNVITNLFNR